jgi:glucans biosynthesis protein C
MSNLKANETSQLVNSVDKSINFPYQNRLYYIDWLRVIAILAVFFYHCDRFFDFRLYPIQISVKSLAVTIHRDFFQIWMMPLFFVISGAAVYYSLKSRKAWAFSKERVLRLLIPLVTIGIFIIAPPQIYVERLYYGKFTGSFFEWYPHYFDGIYPSGNFAFQGMHLWYLLELFLYSMILLPLFISLGKTKTSILSRVSFIFEKPWSLLLLFLPLAAVVIFAEKNGMTVTKMMGGWDPLSYLIFFIYGYIIFSNTKIQENIKKYSVFYLITACVLTVLHLFIEFSNNFPDLSGITRYNQAIKVVTGQSSDMPGMTTAMAGILIFKSLLAWCWILCIIGIGSRVLNFKNRILEYCNEAVLPFYILHQTMILVIGYYVIQWNVNIAVKYLTITVCSFVVVMALYELLVRRINILRFLFGMKIKQ